MYRSTEHTIYIYTYVLHVQTCKTLSSVYVGVVLLAGLLCSIGMMCGSPDEPPSEPPASASGRPANREESSLDRQDSKSQTRPNPIGTEVEPLSGSDGLHPVVQVEHNMHVETAQPLLLEWHRLGRWYADTTTLEQVRQQAQCINTCPLYAWTS